MRRSTVTPMGGVEFIATTTKEADDHMAKVNQRPWKAPGQRAKRRAWGFTVQVDRKQKRVYKSEWTKEDAEKALAAFLLKIDQRKPARGITLAEAAKRYVDTKARKRTLKKDERILNHLESVFGAGTALTDLTASRIAEYKAKRLATKVGPAGQERLLTAAAVNRPLALLRHLLRTAHDEWEVLPAVPKFRLEREPQGRLRWLTEDEIKNLLATCGASRNQELRPAVVVALNTGLRRGYSGSPGTASTSAAVSFAWR